MKEILPCINRDEVYGVAKDLCCDGIVTGDDNIMQDGGLEEKTGGMMAFVKSTLEDKVSGDLHWKD